MSITFIPARKVPRAPSDGTQTDGFAIDAYIEGAFGFAILHPALVFIVYLLFLNAVTWILFWADKQRAIRNEWRTSESALLMLMLLGGTIGAFAARKVFRHKTRKQPFVARMKGIAVFQALLAATLGALVLLGEYL